MAKANILAPSQKQEMLPWRTNTAIVELSGKLVTLARQRMLPMRTIKLPSSRSKSELNFPEMLEANAKKMIKNKIRIISHRSNDRSKKKKKKKSSTTKSNNNSSSTGRGHGAREFPKIRTESSSNKESFPL